MENMNFSKLIARAYRNACKKGWHKEEYKDSHYFMLVVTELGEAVNADRIGKYAKRVMFENNFDTSQSDPKAHWKFCFETFIKDSVEDELADAVIRLLDFAGLRELSIDTTNFTEEQYTELSKDLKGKTFSENMFCVILAFSISESFTAIIYFLFAIAYHYKIDLLWHIEQKMKYNEMRPYKHGKKY